VANAVATERGSKSKAIRAILKKKPNASVQEIQDALKQQGVEASTALVSKLKYSKGKKRWGRQPATATAGRPDHSAADAQNGTEINKSQAIRDAFKELGRSSHPKEIRIALAEKGIAVSSAQISNVRTAMRAKRKQRTASAPGRSVESSTASLSIDNLLAAKKLVEQVGSIEAAQQAVQVFGRLQS